MHYRVAKVASNWWIEQMKKRCKQLYPDRISGNFPNLTIIDNSFAKELGRFEKILTEEIYNNIERNHYICFTCYYIPNTDLAKLAKRANISTTYFPTHAEMRIWKQSIEVALNGSDLRKLPLPIE